MGDKNSDNLIFDSIVGLRPLKDVASELAGIRAKVLGQIKETTSNFPLH